MKKKYLKRIADDVVSFALKSKGCVLITGPKWCGKSRTAEQFANSCIYMQNSNDKEQNINLAKTDSHIFLTSSKKPLLIDEWQVIPFIWDAIRYEIDQNNEFGQFILTGSSTPIKENSFLHTGTGRIVSRMMRPMSLYESLDSDGSISLKDLFDGNFSASRCDKSIKDYAYYLCRGGWPLAINEPNDIALQQAIDYYNDLVEQSLFNVPDIKIAKNVDRARLIVRSYSRNIATQCSDNEMSRDANVDIDTFNKYLSIMKNLFVVEESQSWNTNLRSKTSIRSKATRYFVDPSIATSSLGLNPDGLIKDLKTFGLLFENMAIRDLRIYAESIGARVYHYRDRLDREVDAIIQFNDGRFAMIEIKLGSPDLIDESAKKLIKLSNDIVQEKRPSFLMILTTSKAAYKRDDGVLVVPLANLKN